MAKVQLVDYDKAKRYKKIVENIWMCVFAVLLAVGFSLIIWAIIGAFATGVWNGIGLLGFLAGFVGLISMSAIGNRADEIIREAEEFGVVDD